MADDLVTWLRARYDEREQKAKAAAADYAQDSGLRWRIDIEGNIRPADPVDNSVVAVGGWGGGVDEATGLHIVDNDPQSVLADLESKRRILDEHNDPMSDGRTLRPGGPRTVCGTCREFGMRDEQQPWPCNTLRFLALPYADRPGYRDEWKP
ncbi:hypothetical protein PSN13_06493 [Micromonospora saelicesensis]|uniref:Uncharacterized protein n=1 Tax=Micromonospora saelicesensis TaxID=285676 RepID=A0A328NGZ7_9ACTN|nr:DUF6221 family protein [Micromonospora saelicesensis]RAO26465.1 hypothetical protein PSN13_06493 [Micromonospora saelicesensis]